VTNHDSGSGVYSIPITKGNDSNLYGLDSSSDSKTIFTASFYEIPNYYVINTMYYRDINQMLGQIDWINGTPKNHSGTGVVNYTKTRHLQDTPTNSSKVELRRPYSRQLHDTAVVVSVPQNLFGETLSRKSIELVDSDNNITIHDDGRGNLYDIAFSSSYASRTPDSNNSGSVVGNVFYDDGLLVITDTGSYSNVGNGNFNLTFDSTKTIYEREYVCRVEEDDFLHTTNRSLKVGYSSSISFHGTDYNRNATLVGTYRDEFPYEMTGFATGGFQDKEYKIGTEYIGEATHSDFGTYVTGIGLYNSNNELVAIGKTAKPVKNDKEMSLTFVVRFDTT
jgi:hypothetical protein